MARFSEDRIFPAPEDVDDVALDATGDRGALDVSIEAEDRFAEYFSLAADHALTDEGRTAFAWLASEEACHAEKLRERRRCLFG